MRGKIKQSENERFEKTNLSIDKLANANTVIGESIITVSGYQVIPLSSVTVINLGGGGEYGDVKTFREADGFKIAGGNGTVVTIKPKGFLVDDGKTCKLLKMDESIIESIFDKTGEIVKNATDDN